MNLAEHDHLYWGESSEDAYKRRMSEFRNAQPKPADPSLREIQEAVGNAQLVTTGATFEGYPLAANPNLQRFAVYKYSDEGDNDAGFKQNGPGWSGLLESRRSVVLDRTLALPPVIAEVSIGRRSLRPNLRLVSVDAPASQVQTPPKRRLAM